MVETNVVNQEEALNHDWNQLWDCSHSVFLFSRPSRTLAIESLTMPE